MTLPNRRSIDDICGLENPKSIIRAQFLEGRINIKNCNLPKFKQHGYQTETIYIKDGEDTLNYYGRIAEICKQGSHTGKHERFVTAVIEAFRNAYQHGNKKDKNKNITISYKATPDTFEVVVSDQGGDLNPNFIPFILLHRQALQKPHSFYEFAPHAKHNQNENSGIGTYTMHLVSDEVNYLKNKDNGLSVQLIIRKN